MFGSKSAKFRSIQPNASLSHLGFSVLDNAEFTKSDREKSAEILFDWRSRRGWDLRQQAARSLGVTLLFWIGLHGLFILAALAIFRA